MGGPGASGGGGSSNGSTNAAGGTGTSGQGTNGSSSIAAGGGGGGGAGTGGFTASQQGGNGITSSVTGTSTYYGGGGSGGGATLLNGGVGGGGKGGTALAAGVADGTANTGGGGGGSIISGTGISGIGGSGIVVVRFPQTAQTTYEVHTFTQNGATNFNVSGANIANAEYLVVGGGGGGGSDMGGGGGAGGYTDGTTSSFSSNSGAYTTANRVNLSNNPSFETAITNWAGMTRANITTTTAKAFYGNSSMLVTATASPSVDVGVSPAGSYLPVKSGKTYTASLYALQGTGTTGGTLRLRYFDAAGTQLAETTSSLAVLSTSNWTRISATAAAPATAVNASIVFSTPSTVAANDTWYLDAVLLEESGSADQYFDGSSVNSFWTGTANVSSSVMTVTAGTGKNYTANVGFGGAGAPGGQGQRRGYEGTDSTLVDPTVSTSSPLATGGTITYANVPKVPAVTGGTVTNVTVGGNPYEVHTFTQIGANSLIVPQGRPLNSVDYLVVGGGGGGGNTMGGGGGAGGVQQGTTALSPGTYTVNVGTTGIGASTRNVRGGNGGDSYIVPASDPIYMVGGTVSYISIGGTAYKVHTFTDTGANSFSVNGGTINNVNYLVVGGGGGGGNTMGGGGGAGGLIQGTTSIGEGTYSVNVGSGGAGATDRNTRGGQGKESIFGNFIPLTGGTVSYITVGSQRYEVHTFTSSGNLTVSGTVNNAKAKADAEAKANAVPGVVKVVNNVEVQS